MARIKNFQNSMQRGCEICGKKAIISYNRPNSLHKTKKLVLPNLQSVKGKIICTKCLKSELY